MSDEPGQEQNQQQQGDQGAGAEGQQGENNTPQRPDNLPDDFWNEETGVDVEGLLGQRNELAAFKAERDSHAAQVPENADGYELKLPDSFEQPDPDNPVEINADDPRLPVAREFAHENDLSQAQFEQLLELDHKFQAAEAEKLNERLAEEKKALGSKADARIDAVETWLAATVGTEHAGALLGTLFTQKQVEAFEKIMAVAKGGTPKPSGGDRDLKTDEISDEEYEAMSPDQRLVRAREIQAKKRQAA